ncbi:MAG: hypothetical protein HKL90_08590 [Elusimicrobia bacterium]|nr:hypothetical protein [Elusimicrobiota bacterium]
MIKILLAAAILSAATAAHAQAVACPANPDLDGKAFALWITSNANPDAVPCASRLFPSSCTDTNGQDVRVYSSPDGRYSAVMAYSDTADSGVTVYLRLANAAGVGSGSVALATYPYQRAFYRGVGVDDVQVFDTAAQTTTAIGNVMLIPVDALTANGQAQCPQ